MRYLAAALLALVSCATESSPVGATSSPVTPDPKLCTQRPNEFCPITLTAEQAPRRYGFAVKKFAEAPTTKERPIEVCGIRGQHEWLLRTTCADGSAAFPDAKAVRESRGGSTIGGRCGSAIDVYTATCPEGEYDVYIDMYMCAAGDEF